VGKGATRRAHAYIVSFRKTAWASLRSAHPTNQKIKKETERRETPSHEPRHRGRTLPFAAASGAAPPNGAARLSAFHRGSRRPVFTVPAQLQARLPGTWREQATLWTANRGEDRVPCRGRYPCPPVPVQRQHPSHRP